MDRDEMLVKLPEETLRANIRIFRNIARGAKITTRTIVDTTWHIKDWETELARRGLPSEPEAPVWDGVKVECLMVPSWAFLTLGKEYDVLESATWEDIQGRWWMEYFLRNDRGETGWYIELWVGRRTA